MNRKSQPAALVIGSGNSLVLDSSRICSEGFLSLEKLITDLLFTLKRPELCTSIFTAVRELIQNATKASLKRIIFEEIQIDPASKMDYTSGLQTFKKIIHSEDVMQYRSRISQNRFRYSVQFDYLNGALIVQVKSVFLLFLQEEFNIREKFRYIQSAKNLMEFYKEHSDLSEGSGMGIALIHILLQNSGVNPRNFVIYNDFQKQCTISRFIVPMEHGYVSPREEFLVLLDSCNLERDCLRNQIRSGERTLKSLSDAVA
ncbi:MAG: hypothetical protein OEZ34_09530 [Spirochaetia bacterium]|nr:hypothetical protein [Spirochaetia bacterium]